MARYVKFFQKFWTDERTIRLSADARALFFYFITSPHGNCLGLYTIPPAYVISDIGWTLSGMESAGKRFEEGLAELLAQRLPKPFQEPLPKRLPKPFQEPLHKPFSLIEYDKTVNLVWIPNFLKHNPLENSNQMIAAAKKFDELPRSDLLIRFFYTVSEKVRERLLKPFKQRFFETVTETLSETVTETVSATVTETVPGTVTETVTETSVYRIPKGMRDTGAFAPCASVDARQLDHSNPSLKTKIKGTNQPDQDQDQDLLAEFEKEIWPGYPRKIAKAEAKDLYIFWRKKYSKEQLLTAVRNYAEACRLNNTESQYIQHGSTFFSKKKQSFAEYINGIPDDTRMRVIEDPIGFLRDKYEDKIEQTIEDPNIIDVEGVVIGNEK